MAAISPLYPISAIHIGDEDKILPDNGEIPVSESWKRINVPGDTKGIFLIEIIFRRLIISRESAENDKITQDISV